MTNHALLVVPGAVLTREAALASWEGVAPWAGYQLDDLRPVPLTADSALVTYAATAWRSGEPPYRARLTTVYVRRNGEWKLAFHQQTPPPASA